MGIGGGGHDVKDMEGAGGAQRPGSPPHSPIPPAQLHSISCRKLMVFLVPNRVWTSGGLGAIRLNFKPDRDQSGKKTLRLRS